MDKKFLSTKELAERWGIPESALMYWRTTKVNRGPNYVKIGRRVLYDIEVINEYEKNNTTITGR